MTRPTLGTLFLLCTFAATTACKEKPAEVEPTATVEAPFNVIDLPPGGSNYVLFEVHRAGTHDAPVHFSVVSASPGITARFERTRVEGIVPVTPLYIAVSTTVVQGEYTVVAQAQGKGVVTRTFTVTVKVTLPGLALNIGTTALSVEQLALGNIPVSIERTGGYAGPVGISIGGLPLGVTATIDRASIPAGATTATISLHPTLVTPLGEQQITVKATGVGGLESTVPVSLTVLPTSTPAVQIEPSASIPLVQGNASEVTIHVKRFAGYSGSVHFAIGQLPPLVTASIDPITTLGNSTTLRVSTDSNTAVGSFPIEVTATGDGIAPAKTMIALLVSIKPGIRASLPPLVARVRQGAATVMSFIVGRDGGYGGPITVEMSGLPPGVTTTPDLSTFALPAQTVFHQVDFSYVASANAAPGPAIVTLRARGNGIAESVAAQSILVETMGSYQLQLTPPTLTIARGQSGSSDVAVTRLGGYNGVIAFSLVNAPPGITASFTPASTDSNAAQMTVHVAPSVAPGSYLMFVRGQNPGSADVERQVTVVVTN